MNPYDPPQAPNSSAWRGRLAELSLGIYSWGFNLFGALLCLLAAFGLWGAIELASKLNVADKQLAGLVLMIIDSVVFSLLDVLVRTRSRHATVAVALFSPRTGGSFFFVPIWCILGAPGVLLLALTPFRR
ncbi:hypothetical protein [Aureliella helgolandensis]|uniref:hypothetical protein n=1 Tax=Aureliella helgolandensis TaxID=2527968 RepID=UPI0018D0B693|nr:hypothetical protein [Aureliella helgolandensis]